MQILKRKTSVMILGLATLVAVGIGIWQRSDQSSGPDVNGSNTGRSIGHQSLNAENNTPAGSSAGKASRAASGQDSSKPAAIEAYVQDQRQKSKEMFPENLGLLLEKMNASRSLVAAVKDLERKQTLLFRKVDTMKAVHQERSRLLSQGQDLSKQQMQNLLVLEKGLIAENQRLNLLYAEIVDRLNREIPELVRQQSEHL